MSPIARSLVLHGVILLTAGASATYAWLREKAPNAAVRRDVVVWRGRAADVDRLEYVKGARRVVLDGKTDATGKYFVGTAHSEVQGESGAPGHDAKPAPAAPRPAEASTFVTVASGQKIAEKLGELRALRDLGRITDEARLAELGLKTAEARVVVTVRGAPHTLELGSLAPGGADTYVREVETGTVFVVESEPLRDLEAGERSLPERTLHEFPMDPDVDRVTISAGDKKRSLVRRGAAAGRFFADPATPDKNEEAATTWMSKLDRLRPTDYVAKDPAGADRVRVDYAGRRDNLGFLEILKTAGNEGDVFVRTERTRLWAKVTRGAGEQILADVPTVVR